MVKLSHIQLVQDPTYSLVSEMLDQAFERLTEEDNYSFIQIKAGIIK